MRIRLTKLFAFEMAHALPGYDGACRHLHGHSFHLEVTVVGTPLQREGHPKNGMVMDFKDLKTVVNRAFVEQFDHALALPDTSPPEVVATIEQHFGKVVTLPFQPTCENLIALCVENVGKALPPEVELCSIRLSETDTSVAEWHRSDQY